MKKNNNYFSKPDFKDLLNSFSLISGIFVVVFLTVVLILTLPLNSLSAFKTYSESMNNEWGLFAINHDYETIPYILFPFLLGLSQFMFLHYKKNCQAVFAFPVRRKTIFNNRIILPFALMLLGATIIKTVALAQNIEIFCYSTELLILWLINLFRLFSMALFTYSTAVVFAILCGRFFEAAVAGYSFLFIPLSLYLLGFETARNTLYGYAESDVMFFDLFTQISIFNLDSLGNFNCYGGFNLELSLKNPLFYVSIFYVAFSVIALISVKRYFIKKYKPENSGFRGVSKIANFIICISPACFAGYYACAIFARYVFDGPKSSKIVPIYIITLLVIILFCLICTFFIHLSVKKIKGAITPLISLSLVVIILAGVYSSDIFGTYNKIPSAEKIQRIQINPPQPTYNVLPQSDSVNMGILKNLTFYTFNTPEDIEKCLDFYKVITENRDEETGYDIDILFLLKGENDFITRKFDFTDKEVVKAALKLWDTDAVKDSVTREFFPEGYPVETGQEIKCKYYDSSITIHSLYTARTVEKLEKEDFDALRKAVLKDTLNLSVEERYFPDTDYLGSIDFTITLDGYADLGNNQHGFISSPSTPVNENMTETIKVLKEIGLYESLFKKEEIVCAYTINVTELDKMIHFSMGENYPCPLYYIAGEFQKSKLDLSLCNQLTDKEKVTELIKNSQRFYLTGEKEMTALVVSYKNDTDNYSVYFLPEGT